MKTLLLFLATAVAEIVGCYLPYLWLKQGKSAWLLVPGALSLALFACLLSMHDTSAGRVYAAYGGVYIGVAIGWLWDRRRRSSDGMGRRGRSRGAARNGHHHVPAAARLANAQSAGATRCRSVA